MEAPSLIALGVARLEGEPLVQRLAALARRCRDGGLPDRVRSICAAAHVESLVEDVRREAFRQERIVQKRERRPELRVLTPDQRRWRTVDVIFGPPERWLGEHAHFVDGAITVPMVLGLIRSGWASQPPMRAALAFRPFRLPAESVRVPRTLGRVADVIAWVVHEDLPSTPSGDALGIWLRGRPRCRGMKP